MRASWQASWPAGWQTGRKTDRSPNDVRAIKSEKIEVEVNIMTEWVIHVNVNVAMNVTVNVTVNAIATVTVNVTVISIFRSLRSPGVLVFISVCFIKNNPVFLPVHSKVVYTPLILPSRE